MLMFKHTSHSQWLRHSLPVEIKPWLTIVIMVFPCHPWSTILHNWTMVKKPWLTMVIIVFNDQPWTTMLHSWTMVEQPWSSWHIIVNHGQPFCITVTMVSYLIKTMVTMVNHGHHGFNQVTIIIHGQLTGYHG